MFLPASLTDRLNGKLFPTIVVGSHAAPGWLYEFRHVIRSGKAGPDDIAEAYDDAARMAILDQQAAGIDIISDGELRRQRFVYEMYDRLTGMERQKVTRRLGLPGYHMTPKYIANDRLHAPDGLGLVDELTLTRDTVGDDGTIVKIAVPGPLTFAGNIIPGEAYQTASDPLAVLLDDLVALIRTELVALQDAGCALVQLDEPGFPNPPAPLSIEAGAAYINKTLEGLDTGTAVHVCFGNNISRPFVARGFDRLFPGLDNLHCDILLLEFANREMAGIETLTKLPENQIIAAGVIDVKSYHVESAEEIAWRIEKLLQFVPKERLWLTADCGFSAIPRFLAQQKLAALKEGASLARQRFS